MESVLRRIRPISVYLVCTCLGGRTLYSFARSRGASCIVNRVAYNKAHCLNDGFLEFIGIFALLSVFDFVERQDSPSAIYDSSEGRQRVAHRHVFFASHRRASMRLALALRRRRLPWTCEHRCGMVLPSILSWIPRRCASFDHDDVAAGGASTRRSAVILRVAALRWLPYA